MKRISPSRLIITLLSSILVIVLILYLKILYFNFFPKGEDISIYLPKNYDKNYIIIIYGQKDGIPEEKIGDNRIFRIPKSGLFFTQFNMQREWVKYRYYYVNEKGNPLKEIKYKDDEVKLNADEVYVMISFSTFKEVEGYDSEHIIIGKPNIIGKNNSFLPLTKTRIIQDSVVISKGLKK